MSRWVVSLGSIGLSLLFVGCAAKTEPPGAPLAAIELPATSDVAVVDGPGWNHDATRQGGEPKVLFQQTKLVAAQRDDGIAGASTSFAGWPTTNATDGDEKTSWYSDTNDSAAKGKETFFQLVFDGGKRVHRVSILGNRDPAFFDGFTISAGRLDVFDADGRIVASATRIGTGDRRDFVFDFGEEAPLGKVVRFTSIRDDGDKNAWGDVAIAEFRVE
jgi:hypothetical protein